LFFPKFTQPVQYLQRGYSIITFRASRGFIFKLHKLIGFLIFSKIVTAGICTENTNSFNEENPITPYLTQYAKIKGVPYPAIAQGMAGLTLLLGGLSIMFGIYTSVGIILLVAFLVPVTLMMHNFWKLDDHQMRMADKVNFTKNMALLGAILMLLAIPSPWHLSLVH